MEAVIFLMIAQIVTVVLFAIYEINKIKNLSEKSNKHQEDLGEIILLINQLTHRVNSLPKKESNNTINDFRALPIDTISIRAKDLEKTRRSRLFGYTNEKLEEFEKLSKELGEAINTLKYINEVPLDER